jgi:probable rRNA maturation factor
MKKMKNSVEVTLRPGQKPPVDAGKTAQAVLSEENAAGAGINLVFVSPAEMKQINLNYRKKAKETDVIAFGYAAKKYGAEGDVFISLSKAAENAAEFGCTLKEETGRLIIHGVLHVLGYDHMNRKDEAEMTAKTLKYMKMTGGRKQ